MVHDRPKLQKYARDRVFHSISRIRITKIKASSLITEIHKLLPYGKTSRTLCALGGQQSPA